MRDIEEVVRHAIKDVVCLDKEPGLDDNLKYDLGIDSIDFLELATAVERELNISINTKDLVTSCATVRDLVTGVKAITKKDEVQ